MTYNDFCIKLKKTLGIDLSGYKSRQMERRIINLMGRHQCSDLNQYLQLIKIDTNARKQFINHLTINVTEFFRNPDLFKFLEKVILPSLVQKSSLFRIWSAACSNGAEPYSLAILMHELFPQKRYYIDATDIDEQMLTAASQGKYYDESIKKLPNERVDKCFDIKDDAFIIKSSCKKNISFRRHNLLSDAYPENYDLIVCRNVIIYFTPEAQDFCYRNFARALKNNGVLFIGASENFLNYKEYGFERIHPCFYRKSSIS